jgi:membrane fusion protein, multidrug efflux system
MNSGICLAVTCIILNSCNKSAEVSEAATSKLTEIAPTSVSVKAVEEKPFEYLIHTTGKIRPQYEAKIVVKSEGVVTNLFVANGDFVSKGQVIAELENEKPKIRT